MSNALERFEEQLSDLLETRGGQHLVVTPGDAEPLHRDIGMLRHENRVLRESLQMLSKERGEAIVRMELVAWKDDDGALSQRLIVSYPVLDATNEQEMCRRFVRTFQALLGIEQPAEGVMFGHDKNEVSR